DYYCQVWGSTSDRLF
nr:immunoglobulin light chain junction region [Macaca mulatta]